MDHPQANVPPLAARHVAGARLFADRYDLVASLASARGGIVAEVGVAHGDFSEFLMETLDPAFFVAIDIFRMHEIPICWGVPSSVLLKGMSHVDFYSDRFARWGDRGAVEVGLSHERLARYPDRSFDLIYVDAGHDYDSIKRDGELAARKIKETGTIVFNDYIMFDHVLGAPYGVVPAVNEIVVAGDWKVYGFAFQTQMFCDIAIQRPL